MKVLLIDDHYVVRQGVSMMLAKYLSKVSIHQAESLTKAYNNVNKHVFDLVILDVHFPKGSSMDLLLYMKLKSPSTKILILSGMIEEQYAVRYIQAGADGYLDKLGTEKELQCALNAINENKIYVSNVIKEKVTSAVLRNEPVNALEVLSNRELEVARLLSSGEGNLEIANKLNLSSNTVSTYKYRVFDKLKINNIISLASILRTYSN